MANQHRIVIDGTHVKELRCKNDACRALLGWESVKVGVLAFTCTKCLETSVFKIQYKQMGKELMDKLESKFGKGVTK